MIDKLNDYKKEISSLKLKKDAIERDISKYQGILETEQKRLSEDFGITEDDIDEKITEMQAELDKLNDAYKGNIDKLSQYIEKLEKVIKS